SCHLEASSLGLKSGLAQVNKTRPFRASAAPLVMRPQLAASHLPGSSSAALSKSAHICSIQADVELLGTEFSSMLPTAGFCAVSTIGTPPYNLTSSKYCHARQKCSCPFS